MKKYINGKIYSKNFKFEIGSFCVDDNGLFFNVLSKNIDKNNYDEIIDLDGRKVIPTLFDIHTHGALGFDFSDLCNANIDNLKKCLSYYKNNGISNVLATTLTISEENLINVLSENNNVFGYYMEGPFISREKKGAQNEDFIREIDVDLFNKFYKISNKKIKVVTLAPEKKGALGFIDKVKNKCRVSIAHTNCDYETARKAFEMGATGITHLFNAMNGIKHREPGPIIAAIENNNVYAEIICDGLHIDPSMIRFAFNNFGAERMILISDSLRCLGMQDGEYDIGGQKCFLKNNIAKLSDGTIAGSATNLYQCMKNAIDFGIRECDVIRTVTYNPAKYIGVDNIIGSIANGKIANFIICDEYLNIKNCINYNK